MRLDWQQRTHMLLVELLQSIVPRENCPKQWKIQTFHYSKMSCVSQILTRLAQAIHSFIQLIGIYLYKSLIS